LSKEICFTAQEPCKSAHFPTVVNIPQSVYKSYQCKYFLGQSQLLNFGNNLNTWGALFNPKNSGVNLYVSVYTVTNTSDYPFKSRVWVDTPPIGTVHPATVIPANLTCGCIKPKVQFLWSELVEKTPAKGTHVLTRMVPAKTTLVNEKEGKIVIPPGGSFLVYLVSPGPQHIQADIAFGWWEEEINCE